MNLFLLRHFEFGLISNLPPHCGHCLVGIENLRNTLHWSEEAVAAVDYEHLRQVVVDIEDLRNTLQLLGAEEGEGEAQKRS